VRSVVPLALAALIVTACGGSGAGPIVLVDANDAGPILRGAASPEADAAPPAGEVVADAVGLADASGVVAQVVDGAADAAADVVVDAPASPACPGYERVDVPIGSCLYLNGGMCLAFNLDGTPDCSAPLSCSPVGHCATAEAVSKPLVFYASPETPDARRILHVGACPEVCL
jgi:hypothetical protein